MLGLLWGLGCAVRGPAPPPVPRPVALAVPSARNAGSFSLGEGAWSAPGADADCVGRSLVLAVDAGSVRLDGVEVLALPAERVSPDRSAAVQAALAPWVDAAALRRIRCGGTSAPTLGLALHPDLPWETVRDVLVGAGMAGVAREALLVAGPAGVPLVTGAPPGEHVQVTGTLGLAEATWTRPQVGRHTPLEGPLDAALPLLVDGNELGCAVLVGRSGLRFSRVVAEMDRLAGAGAQRFVLADAGTPASSGAVSPPVGAPGLPLADGSVAAFLLELPTIEPTPPGAELHAGSECSPVLHADRAAVP